MNRKSYKEVVITLSIIAEQKMNTRGNSNVKKY